MSNTNSLHETFHSSNMGQWLTAIWGIASRVKYSVVLLNLALVLTLSASLNHMAFSFASVNDGSLVLGYAAALALDVGLISLAIGIRDRRGHGKSLVGLWAGVFGFCAISVYGNWLSGLAHIQDLDVTTGQVGQWLVWLRPILLSAVLPIMTIYLSEIISADKEVAEKLTSDRLDRLTGQTEDAPVQTEGDTTFSEINELRKDQMTQRQVKVVALVKAGHSHTQIADELGVSPSTVKRDIKSLNGQLSEEVSQ